MDILHIEHSLQKDRKIVPLYIKGNPVNSFSGGKNSNKIYKSYVNTCIHTSINVQVHYCIIIKFSITICVILKFEAYSGATIPKINNTQIHDQFSNI